MKNFLRFALLSLCLASNSVQADQAVEIPQYLYYSFLSEWKGDSDGILRKSTGGFGGCLRLYTLEEIEKDPRPMPRFSNDCYDSIIIMQIETSKIEGKITFGLDDLKAQYSALTKDDFNTDYSAHYYLRTGWIPMNAIVNITVRNLEKNPISLS